MFDKVRDKIKSVSEKVKGKTQKVKGKIAAIGFTAIMAMSMAVAASAEEGTTATQGTTASLTEATSTIFDITTQVFNYILNNWYLLLFFAGGVIILGIRIFKAIKRSAKA